MSRGITGLILAGGQGRRMGGVDKGLQPFRGKPLVEHVIERFSPQVQGLLISAAPSARAYETYGRVVLDELGEGPLAGLHAGLSACSGLLASAPCDAPLLPVDLFRRLVANLNPVFEIQEQRVAMITEFMAAMPLRELGEVRGSLAGHRDRIVRAVDVLLIGV